MDGLTFEDSQTIGFVVVCYFSNSIDTDELHAWAEHVLRTCDDYPPYILDLMEFDQARFHIFRTIGFNPESKLTRNQEIALYGIAYLRGREVYDGPPREKALAMLKRCPEVARRFRLTFPFLALENAE